MSDTLLTEPRPGKPMEDLKLVRRASRKAGLFDPQLLRTAFRQSLTMLRPDIQWKNPVMFTVEVGTVLTLVYTAAKLLGAAMVADLRYLLWLDFWLVATLLFANFASAIAEARGKAQADALRKTRRSTPARRIRPDGSMEETVSTALHSRQPGRDCRRRDRTQRRRDRRGRGLDRRVGHYRRVGSGHPRGRRRPLRRHRRHPRALRSHRRPDHRQSRQFLPRPHDRPGRRAPSASGHPTRSRCRWSWPPSR